MKSLNDIPIDSTVASWFHTLQFVTQANEFFAKQRSKHGDIYRVRLLGHDHVRVHGADFAKLLYQNKNELSLSAPAWQPAIGTFFSDGLLLKDGSQHLTHRRIMQHAFNKPAMQSYQQHIQTWSHELCAELANLETVDFFVFIKERTLDLALRMFLGIDYKESYGKEVAQAFTDAVAATLALVRVPILNNKYHRDIKGRKLLEKVFTEFTQQRRAQPKEDLVSYLCSAEDEQGAKLTDAQVVDHLIFTMMAAHDTTASSLTSVLYFLTEQSSQNWQQKLHTESANQPNLSYENLAELEQTEWVFKETIRLFPPLVTTPRQFNKAITLHDYEIPAGTRTGINIYSTHRDDAHWQHPDNFDPTRFARKEDKHHAYQYIPFGGGVHKCIGMHLSLMESKILLAGIFKQFEVERVNPSAEVKFSAVPIWHPKGEFKLRFNKRLAN